MVHFGEGVRQHQGPKAQPPRVLGHAFRAANGGEAGSHVDFEPLGPAQKVQNPGEVRGGKQIAHDVGFPWVLFFIPHRHDLRHDGDSDFGGVAAAQVEADGGVDAGDLGRGDA